MLFAVSRTPRRCYRSHSISGFTLIELLMVMLVVGILSGILFGISTGVKSSQNKARAKADLAILGQALEKYKSTYGDYPYVSNSSGDLEGNAEDLLFALLGWNRIEKNGTNVDVLQLQTSDVPPTGPKSFIDPEKLIIEQLTGDGEYDDLAQLQASPTTRPNTGFHILDPWGRPYQYLYKASGSAAGSANSWEAFGYVLYSYGSDEKDNAPTALRNTGILDQDTRELEDNIDNIYYGE
ncbi:MAG: prepilin-type N-terminal cleavage/methylation domain-containing protein [Coraliomargarita sp.]